MATTNIENFAFAIAPYLTIKEFKLFRQISTSLNDSCMSFMTFESLYGSNRPLPIKNSNISKASTPNEIININGSFEYRPKMEKKIDEEDGHLLCLCGSRIKEEILKDFVSQVLVPQLNGFAENAHI